jgi:hypothetical protein
MLLPPKVSAHKCHDDNYEYDPDNFFQNNLFNCIAKMVSLMRYLM